MLSAGFYIFTFATMNNVFRFGVLTGTAIVLALLADFYIVPAMMVLVFKRQNTGNGKQETGKGITGRKR